MPLIYEFSNDGATNVAWQQTDAAGGLCFGYSTIWCGKMQQYPEKPLLTKPEQPRAFILQQRVEQMKGSWKESVIRLVGLAGYKCGPQVRINWNMSASVFAIEKGHFIIDIGDHWVAAAATADSFAFFDANEGMTTFASAVDFKTGVNARLRRYKEDTDPDNGWEDKHNTYKIGLL